MPGMITEDKPLPVMNGAKAGQLVVLDDGVKAPRVFRVVEPVTGEDGAGGYTVDGGPGAEQETAEGAHLYPAQEWLVWVASRQAASMFVLLEGFLDRRGYRIVPRAGQMVAAEAGASQSVVCHWTADGVPACLLGPRLQEFARDHPEVSSTRAWAEDFLTITVCAHNSKGSAEEAVETLRKYLPDADCQVANGQCPSYLRRRSGGGARDSAHGGSLPPFNSL